MDAYSKLIRSFIYNLINLSYFINVILPSYSSLKTKKKYLLIILYNEGEYTFYYYTFYHSLSINFFNLNILNPTPSILARSGFSSSKAAKNSNYNIHYASNF